jgi:nucleotide-binding universal stress UspA family protein
VRRDLIGQPEKVKEILLNSATDLGRIPTHQGRGLIDLMQALQPRQAGAGVPLATTVLNAASAMPARPEEARRYAAGAPPSQPAEPAPLRLMYSFSHRDEELKEELDAFLAPLAREGLVTVWSDRAIVPGSEWEQEILSNLESADLIILMISAYFMKSDYCWSKEMTRAVERHDRNSARVIPVIVSHADWQKAPFGKLQALPKDGKPISSWHDQSEGWNNVAKGIRIAAELLRKERSSRSE